MSLIDMNGSLGRIDGGFGFTLQNPNFIIKFSNKSEEGIIFDGSPELKEYFLPILTKIEKKFGVSFQNLKVTVKEAIPEHLGLGSKTQFLLTIALGLCHLKRIETTPLEITKIVGRGGTSGIGYQAFDKGGFILDLGHSFGENLDKTTFLPSSASPAPPAMPFFRQKFPDGWNILIIIPNVKQGANNVEEINIFQHSCPIPLKEIEQISHRILMQVFPSIINRDLYQLADAIRSINQLGFKAIEISLQHSIVAKLIGEIYQKFKVPVGMSSFGPTLYVITDSLELNSKVYHFIEKYFDQPDSPGGKILKTKPNNTGFSISHNGKEFGKTDFRIHGFF
jgi:beta-ribofuranosylaminobenzene 5'-phosphate synthase